MIKLICIKRWLNKFHPSVSKTLLIAGSMAVGVCSTTFFANASEVEFKKYKIASKRESFSVLDRSALLGFADRNFSRTNLDYKDKNFATVEQVAISNSGNDFRITGYNSAKFGFSKSQVLKSIEKDFNIPKSKVAVFTHPDEKTTVLSIELKSLDPMPAGAIISYVLGYKTKKLTQINIVWRSRNAKELDQLKFIDASFDLVKYYTKFDLAPYKVVRAGVISSGIILLGLIKKNSNIASALEMTLSNVKVFSGQDRSLKIAPNRTNKRPIVLKISYIYNLRVLDVFKKK